MASPHVPTTYAPRSHRCRPATRAGFEIAIICALTVERNAIEALLDEVYEADDFSYGKADGDTNSYTTGRVANQHVVLVYMRETGIGDAAGAAASLKLSFRGIKMALVVGVCGGVPTTSSGEEIVLGDVIISTEVVQFDRGKRYPNRYVRTTGTPGQSNREIDTFANKLSGAIAQKGIRDKTAKYTADICGRAELRGLVYPGPERDILYPAAYRHKHRRHPCAVCDSCLGETDDVCNTALRASCEVLGCKAEEQIQRSRIQSAQSPSGSGDDMAAADSQQAPKPRIHFGRIACSNQVMKSAQHREDIVKEEQVIAFEMESAGTWDYVPTVVIKSVADYADCHKSKEWQGYAAVVAVACTRAVLEEWRPADKERASQGPVFHSVEDINASIQNALEVVNAALEKSKGEVNRSDKHCEAHTSEMEGVETKITTLGDALYALVGSQLGLLAAAFNKYMPFLLGSIVLLGVMGESTGTRLERLKRADDEIDAARVEAEVLNVVESEPWHQGSEGNGQHSLDGRADTGVAAAHTDPESLDVLARGDGQSSMGTQLKRDDSQTTTISQPEDREDPAISRTSQEFVRSRLQLQVAQTTNHEEQLSLLHRQVDDLREMSGKLDKSQEELRTRIQKMGDLWEQEKEMKLELERKRKKAEEERNKGWFARCVIL